MTIQVAFGKDDYNFTIAIGEGMEEGSHFILYSDDGAGSTGAWTDGDGGESIELPVLVLDHIIPEQTFVEAWDAGDGEYYRRDFVDLRWGSLGEPALDNQFERQAVRHGMWPGEDDVEIALRLRERLEREVEGLIRAEELRVERERDNAARRVQRRAERRGEQAMRREMLADYGGDWDAMVQAVVQQRLNERTD